MENPDEDLRLEIKTRAEAVRAQAEWCGLKPGMRVMDAGCGPGKTTAILQEMIEPGGCTIGVDYSKTRIQHAREKYARKNVVEFYLHDLRFPLINIGLFDLIWVRFVLEYNKTEILEIMKNLDMLLKPRGILCLIDLDYNCLIHYKLPPKMEDTIKRLARQIETDHNFDPYIGRKLYSYLYDLGYENIEVDLKAHHLFYGPIDEKDLFNWSKKIEVSKNMGRDILVDYPGGPEGFSEDFKRFFKNPRRFTYTPMILCKGTKPL